MNAIGRKLRESIDWKKVEEFYYRSMYYGWPSGKKAGFSLLAGYRQFSFSEGSLSMIDQWSSTPGSTASSGMTTIYLDLSHPTRSVSARTFPIWSMHYGGYYADSALPFLQNVLRVSYKAPVVGEFYGCRGWDAYASGAFRYRNTLVAPWHHRVPEKDEVTVDFRAFSGYEEIFGKDDIRLGFHQYFGGSLIA